MNLQGVQEQTLGSYFSRFAWIPIPLLLIAILVLRAEHLHIAYNYPKLLLLLNIVFSTLISFFITYLIARSFLERRNLGMLMVGCGVLIWGLSALVGVGAALIKSANHQFDVNSSITIHNSCVWLSGFCHLTGVILSMRRRTVHKPVFVLAAAYTFSLCITGFTVFLTLTGKTPVFFIQGQGGTIIRQIVLGSAVAMFALTAVLLRETNDRPLSPFSKWYSLALWLIAVGLFGIMIQTIHSSLLGWTGRFAQMLSGVYMLIAVIASLRESGGSISLQEALRESAQRLRLVLKASAMGTFEVDLATGRTRWNDTEYELLGIRPDAIPSNPESFFKFVHPEDLKTLQAQWQEAVRTGNFDTEFRIIRGDGEVRWLAGKGQFFSDKDHTARFMGVNFDITERKQAEEKYRELIETSNSIIMKADKNLNITFMNEFGLKFFGYTWEELIGRNVIGTTIPVKDEADNDLAAMAHAILSQPEKYKTNVHQNMRKNGKLVWVSWTNKVKYDNDRNVIEILSIGNDITELKKAEAALLESENLANNQAAQLQATLDAAPAMIWTALDKDCNVIVGNRTAYEFSRVPEPENLSKSLTEATEKLAHYRLFKDGRELKPDDMPIQKVARTGMELRDYTLDFMFDTGDVRTLLGNIRPVLDLKGNTTGAVAVFIDITERRKREEELKQTTEELKRSNKDLEAFAYVASHDLREPLRAISGFIGLLGMKYGDKLDEKGKGYINFASEGVMRMDGLLSCLLEYSRIHTRGGVQEPTEVKTAFDAAIANLNASIKEAKAVITCDELPIVRADSRQLSQLFQNLIHNAVKFRNSKKPKVHIGCKKQEDSWLFSVKDNGIGIEQKDYDRIFKIFQRIHTDKQYPGHGIGLSICRKIVERHGGQIWVESENGKGTTFYFTLNALDEINNSLKAF
ncbi:MAG: hypothetical protein A2Y10_19415 [Planctomycetes bacterium GWF2_41_51]|nr:MAG: hypothetical protein A2Y10_19415 [Planctomycetes bacterium GWF2_41_51]